MVCRTFLFWKYKTVKLRKSFIYFHVHSSIIDDNRTFSTNVHTNTMHLHPKRTTRMTSTAYPSFSTCSPRPIDKQQTNAHTGDRGEKKGGWEKRFEYRKMKWNHPLANDGTCSKGKEKNSQFCDVFPPPLVLFFLLPVPIWFRLWCIHHWCTYFSTPLVAVSYAFLCQSVPNLRS